MAEKDDFFDDLESEAKAAPKPVASLDAVYAMGREAVELEKRITTGERLIKDLKIKRYEILQRQMPGIMDDLKVKDITIDDLKLEAVTHYKANIASDDPPEQREEAFAWVEAAGGGDIIANTVTVAFPKEMSEEASEFAEEVARRFHNHPSIEVVRERKVPWNRLTSWLRDYVESPPIRGIPKLPVPLEKLNATIGRIVKIKPVRE